MKSNVSGDRLTITRRNTRSRKSEEDGGESSSSSMPIPIDLVFEIFSRLPLKSIATCRCVSKLWSSILRRPDFTELFLTRSSARPQILFAGRRDGELFFSSSSEPKVPGKKEIVVVLCNPSTGQSLTLPNLKTRIIGVRSLFGYDPIDKQYKVLSMTRPRVEDDVECEDHQVLTLGGTGNLSWRTIKYICINGVLYYPSIDRSTKSYSIVCFDIRSEKYSLVKEPFVHAVSLGTMVDYNGKLGLILSKNNNGRVRSGVHISNRSILLWVLENPKKQEWSEHIYVLPAVWKNIVGEAWLSFAGVTRSNEIVLSSGHGLYLFYPSLERNTVVSVDIQGIDVCHTYLGHVEDVKLYASTS
ncbi:hypothetical protein EUTSA_v10027150mg [Eutrema salsugineum]|uniref:F-box domain-containing protein n=1 Tax=Eutrema salsugineum TaxID=72664 RepID=V4MHN3_EUTSA|nr:hypothetical protein EUTSA_v10027150mg [Eutrema salsugineum]